MQYESHPLAEIFPLLEGAALAELTADIRANGLHEPIVLFEDKILDGRNRYRACLDAGAELAFTEYRGDDPRGFVISLNLYRRHLDESQRAMVAARIATLRLGDNQHSPIGETSQADAANLLNVGKRSVERARVVQEQGTPELVAAVDAGKVTVSAAADVATLPANEQREIVARGPVEISKAANKVRDRKTVSAKHIRAQIIAQIIEQFSDGEWHWPGDIAVRIHTKKSKVIEALRGCEKNRHGRYRFAAKNGPTAIMPEPEPDEPPLGEPVMTAADDMTLTVDVANQHVAAADAITLSEFFLRRQEFESAISILVRLDSAGPEKYHYRDAASDHDLNTAMDFLYRINKPDEPDDDLVDEPDDESDEDLEAAATEPQAA
jgi:hypothetical protein